MQTEVIPICRICLETLNEYIDMKSFYSEDTQADSKKLTYMDCFKECTHLAVEVNGHVPQGICVPCSLDLRFAYEFLKKAESAAQFYEEYAQKIFSELQVVPMVNNEPPNPPVTIDETEIKIEDVLEFEIEKADLKDALSEIEEFPIPKTQSDEEITADILELQHIKSDEGNYQSDTDSASEIVKTDNENNKNIDHVKKYVNPHEQGISTIGKEITYKSAKKRKRSRKTNSCRVRSNKNSSNSANICKLCQKDLDDLNLTEHMEKCHMHIKKCQHCDYEDKEFKVRKHEKIKHTNKDNYLCFVCSKTFLSVGILNGHLKYHDKQSNFQSDACKICGKTFSTQSYLRRHLETHKSERKLYKCDQCDKLYFSKHSLVSHIKMHTGETMKCVQCDKQFSRPNELKIHMRFHTRVFPYICEICGMTFGIKSHLRSHMWKHQGIKLQCEDCPKLFTTSRALREHSFTHTEMPFPCSYCPKAYTTTYKYRVHLKSAHSVELNDEELQKIRASIAKKPLIRKKIKLVQADSVMETAEVKAKDEVTKNVEELVEELL